MSKQKDLEGKELTEADLNKDEMIFTVKETIDIPDGKHTGYIKDFKIRKGDYIYSDIEVKLTDVDKEPVIKFGFPANISEVSKLGQFLKKSGIEIEGGEEITLGAIRKHLKDKELTFKTVKVPDKENNEIEYARVIDSTIEFL